MQPQKAQHPNGSKSYSDFYPEDDRMYHSEQIALNNQVWGAFKEPAQPSMLMSNQVSNTQNDSLSEGSEWQFHQNFFINMHLVDKITNFKIVKCANPAHYYPSGGPTPAAQGCLDHHGDIVDRRRHLLSQKCYDLVGGQAVSQ